MKIIPQLLFSKNIDLEHFKQQFSELRIESEEDKLEEYNPFDSEDFQSYIPVFTTLFPKNTGESTTLNQKYQILDLNHISDRKGNIIEKPIFIKYAPLVDPIHYLIGKYKDDFTKQKTRIPVNIEDINCPKKVLSPNNSSYIDGFFNYLCSQLLNEHDFVHGVDFYGTFLCTQKKFKLNIADDFEYLQESSHFMKSFKHLYNINHETLDHISNSPDQQTTFSKRDRLDLTGNQDVSLDIIDDHDDDCWEKVNVEKEEEDMEVVFQDSKKDTLENDSDSEDSTNNSVISESSIDETGNDGSETGSSDEEEYEGSESSEDSDDDNGNSDFSNESEKDAVNAYIYNFPVQLICLEKCDGTLDDLLDKKLLKEKEINSAFVQIIFTLLTYQKLFDFTHNDLHTNNILYSNTTIKSIKYKYKNKIYVVPTYGKIYKIIDFGRSIYKFRNNTYCSDSFSKGNDAHSQYNCDPYFNPKKTVILPNNSFDLCRLGCSLHDFFFDEEMPSKKGNTEIENAVLRWCTDDQGKNILYKSSGGERYPNFKLYIMIARLVHKHTPEAQLEYHLCKQYLCTEKKTKYLKSGVFVNIDQLPVYYSR
jgi:hypothetical protein